MGGIWTRKDSDQWPELVEVLLAFSKQDTLTRRWIEGYFGWWDSGDGNTGSINKGRL